MSQNSHDSCARVSFLIKFQAIGELKKFQEQRVLHSTSEQLLLEAFSFKNVLGKLMRVTVTENRSRYSQMFFKIGVIIFRKWKTWPENTCAAVSFLVLPTQVFRRNITKYREMFFLQNTSNWHFLKRVIKSKLDKNLLKSLVTELLLVQASSQILCLERNLHDDFCKYFGTTF